MIQINKYLTGIKPYQISKSADLSFQQKQQYLKLDWNETTIPPSPKVIQSLMDILKTGGLYFYPDVNATELSLAIAEYVKLNQNNVLVYNGSDDALNNIFIAFLNPNDKVLFRDPTYSQIETFIISRGAKIERFLGHTAITFDPEKYCEYLDRQIINIVYIANPNNPTGVMYDKSFIDYLCRCYPKTLFVVDEAYYEFAQVTVVELIKKYSNLIVTRTFSKAFGLAGLRIGYILADPCLLNILKLIRNGKDVNLLAQIAAKSALDDLPYMQSYVNEVIDTRNWLFNEIKKLGAEVYNTPGNFLLIRLVNSHNVQKSLQDNKIFVRDRSSLPQLENSFRVSVGNRLQMSEFLKVFTKILKYPEGQFND